MHLVSEKQDLEEAEQAPLVEEYTELELNSDEAPLLRGQAERISQ